MSKTYRFTREEIKVLDNYRQALRDMGELLMRSTINVQIDTPRLRGFESLARKGLVEEEKGKFEGRCAYRFTDDFYSFVGART